MSPSGWYGIHLLIAWYVAAFTPSVSRGTKQPPSPSGESAALRVLEDVLEDPLIIFDLWITYYYGAVCSRVDLVHLTAFNFEV
jgi:hypothetical protein